MVTGIERVPQLVRQLYSVVADLEKLFPGRRFTPDGHLVGSIGEVLAAHYYGLTLFPASTEGHDARAQDGRLVQIKATQDSRVALRSEPEHLLVLRILPDGQTNEVYNGPGRLAWAHRGKRQSNGQCQISVSRLMLLMENIPDKDKLSRVSAQSSFPDSQAEDVSCMDYGQFVWESALSYLESRADMQSVRQHMSLSQVSEPTSFPDVYRRLLESLVNRQGMPNTIGSISALEDVFYGFDHHWTLEQYAHEWEALFDTIQNNVKPSSRMDKSNASSHWVVFCKGSISGAEYLTRFSSLAEFLRFVRGYDENPNTRPDLPHLLSDEVFGFGFALACDFLKELGFSSYSKPDVHLSEIFAGLGLSSKAPIDVFRAVSLLAEKVGETPYAVDKAFWLIGSGRLYLDNRSFRTNREEFVAWTRSRWSTRVQA